MGNKFTDQPAVSALGLIAFSIVLFSFLTLIIPDAYISAHLKIYALIVLLFLLILTLGTLSIVRSPQKPDPKIQQLISQLKNLDQGMPPSESRIQNDGDVGELARHIYEIAEDLELQNRSVKYLAFHDALTGLSNRVNFQMQLEDQIVDAANHRLECAIMYLDLDDFKKINDHRGHAYGDLVLRAIANRAQSRLDKLVREKRLKSVLLARVGADEFAVLATGHLGNDALSEISENLLQSISQPIEVEGDLVKLSGSIGITLYPRDALGASALFNSADMAMQCCKMSNKGGYLFFEESMTETREQSDDIVFDFEIALTKPDEITLAYQPIVDLGSGRVIGAEALIRWNHPDKGTLYPDQFISVIEQSELALPVDIWVIEQTSKFLSRIDLSTRPEFFISANISASNLGSEHFLKAVTQKISEVPEVSRFLHIEITETCLHQDEQQAKRTLSKLRELGISIWLDDFCTGYSSLHHICMFPVDGIKIDRSFIQNLSDAKNQKNRLLVDALVNLTDSFGIGLIAEGIDNANDLRELNRIGCLHAQGYLFSKPVHEEELLSMVRDDRSLM